MKFVLSSVCLLWVVLRLTAQPVINWDSHSTVQNLAQQVAVWEDRSGRASVAEAVAPNAAALFVRHENHVLDFKNTHATVWVRFVVNNPSHTALLLELGQPLTPDAWLYYRDSSGRWQQTHSGFREPLYQKVIPSHLQLFPLANGADTCYLAFKVMGQPVPLTLWDQQAHHTKRIQQQLLHGIYVGLLVFVVLINLLLYFFFRHTEYLHYTLIVVIYMFFAATFEGYLSYLLPQADLLWWFAYNTPVSQLVGLAYCFSFLETSRYLPRWHRATKWVLTISASYVLAVPFLDPLIVINLNQLVGLWAIITQVSFGIAVGRKGNRQGYPFALTYFIFFALCLLEVIYLQTGRSSHLLYLSYVSLGILFEVLALAFLLVKRFQWERAEMQSARALAQQQLIEQTLENERIVREQNAVLENKVAERTRQLRQANEDLNVSLQNVEHERQLAESLLLNILPLAVARELKDSGATTPQVYPAATVLLTDFKDFTSTTSDMPPEQLVSDLHHCFSAFDQIIQRHHLEKIKTIGDAYLAASGLPLYHEEHAVNAIRAALDIQAFIEEWKKLQVAKGLPFWDVRIGLHTGPVVAGVVGTHKFAYDIWGDTVNTAARFESNSLPGRINISASTYALVRNHFHCTLRGQVEVKGKGALEMYWVERGER